MGNEHISWLFVRCAAGHRCCEAGCCEFAVKSENVKIRERSSLIERAEI